MSEALIAEYQKLLSKQRANALADGDLQRLALLQDVLLELGAAAASPGPKPRPLRAEVLLDVTFTTADEVAGAWSKNLGEGGVALETSRVHPVGTPLRLRLKLPDGGKVLDVEGTVAWAKERAMGVAFTSLKPEDERRIKAIVASDASVLNRLKGLLTADVRDLAATGKTVLATDVRELAAPKSPKPVAANEVDQRPIVRVSIANPSQRQATVAALEAAGVRVSQEAAQAGTAGQLRPAVVVSDPESALPADPRAPLVLLNVSSPDALSGKLANLTPAACINRPAAPELIVGTVKRLLAGS